MRGLLLVGLLASVAGVGQTQINPKIGLTFAQCLRHMLRQDPDVMMVGEIRDRETAEIAVQAAQTGHLVFSTLHTNDSASAFSRLTDIGVEPYQVAGSVAGVMAQRLVRVVCGECREPVAPDEQARALLAGTLLAAPTVVLLDEPTNHLDGEGLQWLEDWLRGFPGTVVVVSHDRAFLDAVVGCVLELEPGGALTRYEGGFSDHRAERERRRAKLALEYEAQEKRRRRLEADIATTRRQAACAASTRSLK